METKIHLKDRAYEFAVKIVRFVGTFPRERIYLVISDQLLRAATSIAANIVEAQAGSSKKDFTNFYQIALKSAVETKFWLELLRDSTNSNREAVERLLVELESISNILAASLLTLKGKRKLRSES